MTDFKWLKEKIKDEKYIIMYEVEYYPTGIHTRTKTVCFWSCDELNNGCKIGTDLLNVYKAFEELAIKWESYENYLAITKVNTQFIPVK